MRFLDNIKMGPKLITAFLVTAALSVILGLFAINKMQIADDADTMLFKKGTVPLDEWTGITGATYRIRTNMRDMLLGRDFEAYNKRIADRTADRAKLEESFEKTIVSDEAKALWKRYKENQAAISDGNRKARELIRNGKKGEAENLIYGEVEKLQQEQNKIYDEMGDAKLKFSKKIADDNTSNFESAKKAMYFMMFMAAGLAVVIGIVIARSIAQPLKKGVDMMNEMAKGHLGMRLKMDRKDEIGELASVMDSFSENLQISVIGTMKKIAAGDLTTETKAADAQDEIAPAMIQMTNSLRAMTAEAQRLAQAAVDGKLATRADASKYEGDYRKIVQGVNDTLDAVIGPLNVAAGYVDRISKGDIPPKITDKYNGDFNEIKNNLNTCVDAVNALVADAAMLSKAAVDGKLATRADASKHQGDFRKIVQGVDDCLDAVIG
ncbi:MAG: MCP four helix bundle domain-containing protein, partial [Holophaga sp.]